MIPLLALRALADVVQHGGNAACVGIDGTGWGVLLKDGAVRAVGTPGCFPTVGELSAAPPIPIGEIDCPELMDAIAARAWRRVSGAHARREALRMASWSGVAGEA